MIEITVNLFSGLDKYTDFKEKKGNLINVQKDLEISKLVEILNIPPGRANIFLVNGKHEAKDYKLQEGDQVSLFPPMGGG